MNLFNGRLKAQAPGLRLDDCVTGNCTTSERIDSDPYVGTLRQAKDRLHAARLAYEAAGYELDRCSDEVARIERMQQRHQQQVEHVLGDPDA